MIEYDETMDLCDKIFDIIGDKAKTASDFAAIFAMCLANVDRMCAEQNKTEPMQFITMFVGLLTLHPKFKSHSNDEIKH